MTEAKLVQGQPSFSSKKRNKSFATEKQTDLRLFFSLETLQQQASTILYDSPKYDITGTKRKHPNASVPTPKHTKTTAQGAPKQATIKFNSQTNIQTEKEESLVIVTHIPQTRTKFACNWPNAWLGLIEALQLPQIKANTLHNIYYSEQYISERYYDDESYFDDPSLIGQLQNIIPKRNISSLPYLAASITGKPLQEVRTFLFQQQDNINIKEATDSDDLGEHISSKSNELLQQLQTELKHINLAPPTDLSSLKSMIKKLEKRQSREESSFLSQLVEKSQNIFQQKSKESGGFLVVNTVDNRTISDFTWIQENSLTPTLNDFEFLAGCSCRGDCGNAGSCQCMHEMRIHGSTSHLPPYTKDGKLNPNFKKGCPIYECNSACSCGSNCSNRVVQKNSNVDLIIFKYKNKGWGVKTLQLITKGTFICEYMGELITSEEAEVRGREYDKQGLSFLLDIDLYGRDDNEYTIDATNYGNVSRFFNHSCSPNIEIYYVFVNILDSARPKICFFATRDIEPGEEITFDYQYDVSSNVSRRLKCHCGSTSCRGWLV